MYCRKKYYYANVKTKQSMWDRPDVDPHFLPESIYLQFNAREHAHLRHLFDDEMANSDMLTIDNCRDVLMEVGEVVSRKYLSQLFKAYALNDQSITSFAHFMAICANIKEYNHRPTLSFIGNCVGYLSRHMGMLVGRICKLQDAHVTSSTRAERLGKWYYKKN